MAARAANSVREHGAEGGAVAGGRREKNGHKGEPVLDTAAIEDIAEHIPDAELTQFPVSSHGSFFEQPAQFNRDEFRLR